MNANEEHEMMMDRAFDALLRKEAFEPVKTETETGKSLQEADAGEEHGDVPIIAKDNSKSSIAKFIEEHPDLAADLGLIGGGAAVGTGLGAAGWGAPGKGAATGTAFGLSAAVLRRMLKRLGTEKYASENPQAPSGASNAWLSGYAIGYEEGRLS